MWLHLHYFLEECRLASCSSDLPTVGGERRKGGEGSTVILAKKLVAYNNVYSLDILTTVYTTIFYRNNDSWGERGKEGESLGVIPESLINL